MRFKKLEIFGFKSFAKKTTVHFEPGVTAIVGPNGSGKSNIVDSIRWVLGEHNPREVRAPRLEDVIFNGTDTMAPLSMAEVHLTIANEQGLLPISFSEVAITRRVYRSGESEYLINQSPCRLKDIQELFLGTGLGGGTYAIIEQGHIDMVLSSKPEERRVVFEEASGVAKYLAKKQETARRLDEVEDSLVRIADIASEVRRQVAALERAANRARQYKSQWEQLKQTELRLAVDELTTGASRQSALEQQLQELTAKREMLEAQQQSHMASLEAINASVSAIQQRLQELRTKVVECASQIEQHVSQHALKTTWIGELAQQAQRLELEEAQLAARLAQLEEQRARVGGGEAEIQTQLAAVETQLAESGSELGVLDSVIQQALTAVNGAKAELFAAASDASNERNRLTDLASQLQGLDAHLARLDGQQTQRAARREEFISRREAAERELTAVRAQHDEIGQNAAATQRSMESAGERRHELNGRLHQLREQLASERAHARLLEDLWRRYEGFPDTVKTLMGRSIDGMLGPLVDIVQAVPGYEDVVEAALGPLADAIVVRDRNTLSECRQMLTSQQLEGCRFLVLSDCPAEPVGQEQPVAQAGVTGAVKQFVRAEPAYQPLVDWLLNDSWVVDDIQRLLGEGPAPQSRLISARGDRWDRRSWRFTGARVPEHSPACAARAGVSCACGAAGRRLGRRQRWEQAQAGLQALADDVSRLESETAQAEQAWQALLGEQQSAKGQLAHLAPSLQKIEASVEQLRQEIARIDEEQHARAQEAQDVALQKEQRRVALGEAQQGVVSAERRQQQTEQSLAEAQASRESADQRRQELLIAKAQVDSTVQSLRDRLQSLAFRRQEIEGDRAQLVQQIQAKAAQRQDALNRSKDLAQQLETHQATGQQLGEDRVRLDGEAGTVSQQLRDEETKRDQVLPHVLAAEQELNLLGRKIQEQTQQLSERTFRRTRLVERLWELYQIDETTIQAEVKTDVAPLADEQRTAMAETVQKLRAKLEGMGPVSLGSVEEYDEFKRRLEFLQAQQQDLTKARDDLKASIVQINRTARAQFRETFDRIKQEFQHYYGKLFNGGEANLVLMDEENVLECGIDIVARPPGKRLQSISLLSGGERALTAIALLFALFKVRPSPFCVLDEIDAPLDEANVDRFTRVLEEFLALSQFILITHNKKTITKADSLYGVTMSEPGISQILSAKLGKSNGAQVQAGAGPA